MTTPITITVSLPWPSKHLSPNGRPKLRDKMSAKKEAREKAFALSLEAVGRTRIASVSRMHVLWCQPDRRPRDDDNLIASFKAYRDGIALALKVDDATFRPVHDVEGPITAGGLVIVTIEATPR